MTSDAMITDQMVEAALERWWEADPGPTNASYESAMRAALTAANAAAWRPIETAPHGRRVLLGWRDWRDGTWCMEVGYASHGRRTEAGSSVSYHGSATDWQPLPAPPQQEGE